MKDIFSSLFWNSLHAATVLCILSAAAGFLGKLHWQLDLLSHFRVQYFLAVLFAAILYTTGRKWRALSAAFPAAVLLGASLLPLYLPASNPPPPGTPTYRLFLANVETRNPNHHLVREQVIQANPDFVILIEVNQNWLTDLDLEAAGYIYTIKKPQSNNFGLALYSRLPLLTAEILDIGGFGYPSISAEILLDSETGETVHLTGTHPPPPKFAASAWRRNQQLAAAAERTAVHPTPTILAGDLNLTPWSPYFRDLLAVSHLKNSQVGFGVQPTWQSGFPPFLRIPIDHILVSERIQVINRQTGTPNGSDHLPVWIDFWINTPGVQR